jgi:hypothetical protein
MLSHSSDLPALSACQPQKAVVTDFGRQAAVVARPGQWRARAFFLTVVVRERPPLGTVVDAVLRDDETAVVTDRLVAVGAQSSVAFRAGLTCSVCFAHHIRNFARNGI